MKLRFGALLLGTLLSACSTVSTDVTLLNPAQHYAPTQNVEILQQPPARPFTRIALLESKGLAGQPETAVIEDARNKAREIGADAIILPDRRNEYQPPVTYYEPWWPPGYYYSPRARFYHPFAYDPFLPYYEVHTVPGGSVYTVKAEAIKFR